MHSQRFDDRGQRGAAPGVIQTGQSAFPVKGVVAGGDPLRAGKLRTSADAAEAVGPSYEKSTHSSEAPPPDCVVRIRWSEDSP